MMVFPKIHYWVLEECSRRQIKVKGFSSETDLYFWSRLKREYNPDSMCIENILWGHWEFARRKYTVKMRVQLRRVYKCEREGLCMLNVIFALGMILFKALFIRPMWDWAMKPYQTASFETGRSSRLSLLYSSSYTLFSARNWRYLSLKAQTSDPRSHNLHS